MLPSSSARRNHDVRKQQWTASSAMIMRENMATSDEIREYQRRE